MAYINGKFRNENDGFIDVVNPATEVLIDRVPITPNALVDEAVGAASKAFTTWGRTTGKERAVWLRKIAEELKVRKDVMAKMETDNCGKVYRECALDIDDSAACFEYYAGLAEQLDAKQGTPVPIPLAEFKTTLRWEPVGVAALVVPWNYPMLMATWKLAPSLAAGCAVILKPSEASPFTAIEFARIVDKLGLPPGVFNLVLGGPVTGNHLISNHRVDKVGFTGSLATGSKIARIVAPEIRNLTLELGGKSPIIVFDDVDIVEAVEWIMMGVFFTTGQICSSTSRCFIHESIYDKVIQRLAEEIKTIHVGDPYATADPSMGAIINKAQFEKVLSYIESGKQSGAKLLCGGSRHGSRGYYIQPTVFTDVPMDARIWREEIFGPVLCIRKFSNEDEVIAQANDTEYGLGAAILSQDLERCNRLVPRLHAGIVWVNCSQPTLPQAPWGGFKKSGLGRDLGQFGLDAYLEVKQVTEYVVKEPGKFAWWVKSAL